MNLRFSVGTVLALLTTGANGEQLLRGQQRQLVSPPMYADNFDQTLPWYTKHPDADANPTCMGSVCGLWGDPHIASCDNRADNEEQAEFGCQVVGTVTLMKNEVYNIQANFQPIGQDAIDTLRHKRVAEGEKYIDIHNVGATVTNDIAIDIANGPTLQLGFANLNSPVYKDGAPVVGLDNNEDPIYPSEEECNVNQMYHGHKIKTVPDLWMGACHNKCDETQNCKYFNWWGNKECELFREGADLLDVEPQEGRVLSGDKDRQCGKKSTGMPKNKIQSEESKNKHLEIGKWRRCPLLFHLDGEMVDISKVNPIDGYLHGDANSKVSVQMMSDEHIPKWSPTSESIRILHNLPNDGGQTEIIIDLEGKGPAEMWPCAFEMNICLPAESKTRFTNTIGLLGSPNGNYEDDLHDKDGNAIKIHDFFEIVRERESMEGESDACKYDLAKLEYCHDTWCIENEEDLLMVPAPGQTLEDIMCPPIVNNACANDYCQLSHDQMEEACKDYTKGTENYETCRLECCHNTEECDYANDHIITGIVTNKATKPPAENETPQSFKNPACNVETGEFENTSTSACPSAPLVKILHGPSDLPDAITENILYDLQPYAGELSERSVSFRINNPFETPADVYVSRKERSPDNDDFLLSTCNGAPDVGPGCLPDIGDLNKLTVPCTTHPGQSPFAVVNIYYVSQGGDFVGVDPGAEVKKCCVDDPAKRDEYASAGYNTVHFSLQIKCSCPTGGAIGDGTQAGQ